MSFFMTRLASYRRKLFLISLVLSFLIISMLTYSFNIGYKMTAKYTPLIDAVMVVKLEVTTAHLWFEKLISGDKTENFSDVINHIEKAVWYGNVMLVGGSNKEGVFIALNNKALELKVEKLIEELKVFKKMTNRRYQDFSISAAESKYDKEYDTFFISFLEDADVVEEELREIMEDDLNIYNNTYYILIAGTCSLAVLIVVLLYRNKKEKLTNFVLLTESNKEQAALQKELKALNDSLEEKVEAQVGEIKKSNELFEMILSTTNNMICIMDLQSNLLLVNHAFERILGYSKKEVDLGLSGIHLMDDAKEVQDKVVSKGYYYGREISCLSKEGKNVELKMDLFLMPDKVSILIVARNVTKKKAYKKERQQEQEYLLQQSRMAQMGEMLSMIAHQWRQPLGAISAVSMDLRLQLELDAFDLNMEEECQNFKLLFSEKLRHIDTYVQSLSTTIDDFRNFYKPDKKTSLVKIQVPAIKALDIIRASLVTSGIEVTQSYLSEKELVIHENEIMHVILNILKNAQDNFKERNMEKPKLNISNYSRDGYTVLEISDNGGGIDEKILSKIFEPYFSTKDEKNGTGLGLHMSKIIIETHHDGKLSVENTEEGACFSIELREKLLSDIND